MCYLGGKSLNFSDWNQQNMEKNCSINQWSFCFRSVFNTPRTASFASETINFPIGWPVQMMMKIICSYKTLTVWVRLMLLPVPWGPLCDDDVCMGSANHRLLVTAYITAMGVTDKKRDKLNCIVTDVNKHLTQQVRKWWLPYCLEVVSLTILMHRQWQIYALWCTSWLNYL